jgi:purine nucleosidase
MKLWLDCDPGFDDWMAILLLDALVKEQGIEWSGCSIVAGNAPIEQVWGNAYSIWKHYSLNIPLFKSELANSAQTTAQHVLGVSGMKTNGPQLPLVQTDPYKSLDQTMQAPLGACEALCKALSDSQKKLTILCLGPLTHIATVLEKTPHLKTNVEQIILMGGSTDRGNHTPAAEFNIAADPQSAAQVFQSGLPVVMLGLNVCRQMQVTQGHVKAFAGLASEQAQWFSGYFDAYQKIRSADGSVPMPLYDPIVMAYLKNPNWFQMQPARVDVELMGQFTLGMTVVDFKVAQLPSNRPANALVAMQVQDDAALDWMIDTLVKRFNLSY